MNAKDLQALTLVRPTRENRLLDPLTVLHLDNRLFLNVPLPLSEECRWTCPGLQRRCCRWRRAPKICKDRSEEIC